MAFSSFIVFVISIISAEPFARPALFVLSTSLASLEKAVSFVSSSEATLKLPKGDHTLSGIFVI